MSLISAGPRCRTCQATEQECAFAGGACCVTGCTHWLDYDASGNERIVAPGRRLLPVEHATERGYQQHRVRHEPPCDLCRFAHLRHNQRVAS